jgi:NADH dehydrogenase (ubiquinone) 1 alpha/beta subcomplex 1
MTEKQNEIKRKIVSIMRSIKPDTPETFESDAHWRNDLGLDSIHILEWVARIEQEFKVVIPDNQWQNLRSVQTMTEYLQQNLSTI